MPTAFIQRLDEHPTTIYTLPSSATSKPLTITQPWPSTPLPKSGTNTKQYFIDAPPYSLFNYTSFAPGSNNINTFGSANFALNNITLTADIPAPQIGTAFFQPKLDIYKNFTTSFSLQFLSPSGNGATFVIQNAASNATGDGDFGLGYSNIATSLAIRFGTAYIDRFDGLITGGFSTEILTDGSVSSDVGASSNLNRTLDVDPADPVWNLGVTVSYDGTNLFYSITNTDSPGFSFSSNSVRDIPTTLSSSNAWVGFTAATEGITYSEGCSITAWNWSNSK
jgi:hypothetical protein